MSAPLRVLLIEDSERDAELLLRELRREYRVSHERVEAAPALRTALAKPWDIILSDYALPGFSAEGALSLVKELAEDAPFLIVSGTIGEELAIAAMRAGAHDFMSKDNLARLLPAVEREPPAAESRKARRRAEQALLASEVRYRRLVETTNEFCLLLDTEVGITVAHQ